MNRSASLLAFFFSLAVALSPGATALAGDCPVCTSSAMCSSFDDGGVAFCVLHAGPVGCGASTMLCCPGQGCSTASGRPSCEGTTCTVVENLSDAGTAGTDAGTIDGGSTGTDAGPSGTDGGPSTMDSGGATVDGGGPTPDAGGGGTVDAGGTTPPATTNCGCRTTSNRGAPLGLSALALVLVGVASRRRR